MNYYTQKIPCELADKLKKAGMPMETISEEDACFNRHITEIVKEIRWGCFCGVEVYYQIPSYGEAFDWIIGQGIFVSVAHAKVEGRDVCWYPIVNGKNPQAIDGRDWEHSAILAIEKALVLIKEKENGTGKSH